MKKYRDIADKFMESTAVPSIVLTPKPCDQIGITHSKFGGLPYLPANFEYPTTSDGKPLALLAQLNFEDLPKLPNFPQSGILQFYLLPNDALGMDSKDGHKVIYHNTILPQSEQMKDFPELPILHLFEGASQFVLEVELKQCPMTSSNYTFDDTLEIICEECGIDDDDDAFDEIHEILFEELEEVVSRVGGYPYFTQSDPREAGKGREKYDTLLFQMASHESSDRSHEWDIIWGDVGVGNFFISLENLKDLDFSDVLYTWDCH